MKKLDLQTAISMIAATQQGNGVAMMHGRKVRSKVFYIAGLATGIPATSDLIEQKTIKDIGITNFDGGNKLNDGRNLLVTGIRFLFDTTASVVVKEAGFKSDAPANFKNGELVISQDGTGNLYDGPIGPLHNYNAAVPNEEQFRAVVPFLIREKSPFFIKALLCGAAAANQAYKLELDCIEFVDEDKA